MKYASVCDGIGAVHVAWRPLGWECAWTCEIEPFPAAVVEHHHGYRNLGDMTAITQEMLDDAGPISLLVGGTPCQSFSVAGLRKGLADPRGNLALRFVQLVGCLRPEWVVWENVPGVLSSNRGRDFGTFLGALAELGYGFAYRVLDAQWFGVAQRRRRVFVVGYLGDWRRAAAVLFERESVFGNPPTRGKAGQRTAARSQGGTEGGVIWRGGDQANSEHCQDHAGTLNCDKGQQGGIIAFHPTQDPISSEDGLMHSLGTGSNGGCATAAVACNNTGFGWLNEPEEVASTIRRQCDSASTIATAVICGDGHTSGTLRSNHRNNSDPVTEASMHVMHGMAVRRLTPLECERLQGFPDDYTAIRYRGRSAADGPRYKSLGNSMAVPVMAWLGRRIAAQDSSHA